MREIYFFRDKAHKNKSNGKVKKVLNKREGLSADYVSDDKPEAFYILEGSEVVGIALGLEIAEKGKEYILRVFNEKGKDCVLSVAKDGWMSNDHDSEADKVKEGRIISEKYKTTEESTDVMIKVAYSEKNKSAEGTIECTVKIVYI